MDVRNKVIWITGASSGIGEALADELFNRGAILILSGRNKVRLNEKKAAFDAGSTPGRCHTVPFDMSKPGEIQDAAEYVKHIVSRVDILINNAGVSQRSYAYETSVEVDRQLFETNFFGPVALTKAVLPWMLEKGGGFIIVMSSMAGKYGFKMRTGYSATKHALNGFFESLRAELHDRNIRVMIICPGRINTPLPMRALTGDGSPHGIMDKGQLNGVPVKKCARIICRAIRHNRKEVFIGRGETFLLVIKRAFPPLYYFLVNRISPT